MLPPSRHRANVGKAVLLANYWDAVHHRANAGKAVPLANYRTRLITGLMPVKLPCSQMTVKRLTTGRMPAANAVTVSPLSASGSRCSHAKRLSGRPQPGLCGRPCRAPVGHTGGQHWLHSLSCPLSELPPMLITDLGNRFFIFAFFRTCKIESRQYSFLCKRNQPRFWAVKLYEPWAVIPPIPAPILPPNNQPNRRAIRPQNALILPAGICSERYIQGCKRTSSNHALLIQQSEIC